MLGNRLIRRFIVLNLYSYQNNKRFLSVGLNNKESNTLAFRLYDELAILKQGASSCPDVENIAVSNLIAG